MESIRAGQRFGDWVTTGTAAIGEGGNGEVWAVTADDGRHGAIKILHGHPGEEGTYRLGRFRDEISFLIAHPDFPGILPLLDSQVSADPRELSWYVMPVAVPILQALGKDPEPRAVVAAMAQIAGTLEALAAKGVAHRDIKPDNLFRLDGSWVIGDFGLVTYPEKDPLTAHGRKLGPTDYMAPEMRDDADTADPGPADVWALAKTLWVLLTGERRPLPGTHRPADAAYTLAERISFTFAPELDRLLEHATQIQPQDRVPIAGMARELRACLAEPPEIRRPASLPELRARAAALTAVPRQHVSDAQDRRNRIAEAWEELEQVVQEAGRELGAELTFDVRVGESGHQASAMLGHPPSTPYAGYGSGCLLFPPGQERPHVEVVVAAAMRVLRDDGYADIAALLTVYRNFVGQGTHEPHEVWTQLYQGVLIASAEQAQVIAEIRAGFMNGFADAMRLAIAILADPRDAAKQDQQP